MGDVKRLILAGFKPDCARKIVFFFRAQGDDAGLQKYIHEAEKRCDLQVLQSKHWAERG